MTTIIDGTSGVTFPAGGVGNPAGAVVGTTDTQTLTNKNIVASQLTGTQTIPKSTLPTGSVLQVVNGSTSTAVVTTVNSTYIDTGLTATITPLFSTSKIIVLVNICGMWRNSGNTWNRIGIKLLRGSTTIGVEALGQIWTNTSLEYRSGGAMYSNFDSPATTSATTYKVQFQGEPLSDNTGVAVQKDGNSGTSQIFLMEIAA